MARYTLYRGEGAPIEDASELIRSTGAELIASRPGLALIEATEPMIEHLQKALVQWRISPEVTAKPPNPRPRLPRKKE